MSTIQCLMFHVRCSLFSIPFEPMNHKRTFLLALLLLTLATTPSGWALDTPAHAGDLLAPGPYPAGVTTTVFVDVSRTDALTKEHRTLVTEIWYPATDDARNLPKNK